MAAITETFLALILCIPKVGRPIGITLFRFLYKRLGIDQVSALHCDYDPEDLAAQVHNRFVELLQLANRDALMVLRRLVQSGHADQADLEEAEKRAPHEASVIRVMVNSGRRIDVAARSNFSAYTKWEDTTNNDGTPGEPQGTYIPSPLPWMRDSDLLDTYPAEQVIKLREIYDSVEKTRLLWSLWCILEKK